MGSCEEGGATSSVIAGAIAMGFATVQRQSAQLEHLCFELGDWLQRWLQFKFGSRLVGRPIGHVLAVGNRQKRHANGWLGSFGPEDDPRHAGFQPRQRDGGSETPENGST
jgi:hypothetical protein